MADEIPIRVLPMDENGALQNGVVALIQVIQGATSPYVVASDDPVACHGLLITACQVYAGILAGQLIALGQLREADKKRGADMAATNFREGVETGKRNYARRMAEQTKGGMQ